MKYSLICSFLFIALLMYLFSSVANSMCVPLFCVYIIRIRASLNVKLVEPRFLHVYEWFPHNLLPNRGEEKHDCRILILAVGNA